MLQKHGGAVADWFDQVGHGSWLVWAMGHGSPIG